MNRDKFYFCIAESVSEMSKDSTKVGAVIVRDKNMISVGYNGFPIGVEETEERWEKPEKYKYVCHAERNAISSSARTGTGLNGSTMYVNKHFICTDCARAIILAGISELKMKKHEGISEKWGEDMDIVRTMFEEAGVRLSLID